MKRFGKCIAAALVAVLTALHTSLSDGTLTDQEAVQVAVATATAFSVWLVPALAYPWMKTAVAAVLATLNMMTTAIVGGIDHGDLVQLGLSALTVLAVGATPAQSDEPTHPPGRHHAA